MISGIYFPLPPTPPSRGVEFSVGHQIYSDWIGNFFQCARIPAFAGMTLNESSIFIGTLIRKMLYMSAMGTYYRILIFCLVIFASLGDLSEAQLPLELDKVKCWAYQIQDLDQPGAISALAESRYDMLVIDPTVTYESSFDARTMVKVLKNSKASDGVHRKLIIAYIDIGQAEEWRWYWNGHPTYEQYGACKGSYIQDIQKRFPWVVACDPDGWAGNYPVAFWDAEWQDIVIHGTDHGSKSGLYFDSMLDEVVQDGFDGVYLDWVEAWEMDAVRQRADQDGVQPAPAMVEFMRAIRAYGRKSNPRFIVIQQNSSDLINHVAAANLAAAVDAIAQEGVWWDGAAVDDDWSNPAGYDQPTGLQNYYLPRLRKYRAGGFPVFICDYTVKNASKMYAKARDEGFIAYGTRRPLSRLTTTPPPF